MLREALLTAIRGERVRRVMDASPFTRDLARRHIAGDDPDDASAAVRAAAELTAAGMLVTIERLAREPAGAGRADAVVSAHLSVLERLGDRGLARGADLSTGLVAMGLRQDEGLACDNVTRVCDAARAAGATVTLGVEDGMGFEARMESTLSVRAALLKEHPSLGVVIPAQLRRAEEYCRALSSGRVRLCKGGYDASAYTAYPGRHEIDRSFVRCLKVLMAGPGYPVIATHDRRVTAIASALAVLNEREPGSYEHQMPYGVRNAEQRRLVRLGAQLRIHVPYGDDWHGYLVRRLAYR